jgi:hypothetical protein
VGVVADARLQKVGKDKEPIMSVANGLIVSFGLCAALASQALAQPAQPAPRAPISDGFQISEQRATSMEKCMKEALSRYPDTTYDNGKSRTRVYSDCMVSAGEIP